MSDEVKDEEIIGFYEAFAQNSIIKEVKIDERCLGKVGKLLMNKDNLIRGLKKIS